MWKYVEDDQKGTLMSVAFGITNGVLFSVLVAFRERNTIRTFCFLVLHLFRFFRFIQ